MNNNCFHLRDIYSVIEQKVQGELFLGLLGMFKDVVRDTDSFPQLSPVTFNVLVFTSDLSSHGCVLP